MSNRVGGRLFSVNNLPGLPNVSAELGGMRYMEHQEIMSRLVKYFQLEPLPFPMGDKSRNLFYLRGIRFQENRWNKVQKSMCY